MARLGDMFGAAGGGTFLGLPSGEIGEVGTGAAIIGADRATPYASVGAYCAGAPALLRAGSADYASNAHHVNFDLGRGGAPDAVDCGDLDLPEDDPAACRRIIAEATRTVRAQGAALVLLGGDDSVQIPMLEALGGPLHIVQIDAHIDWRDEVDGERMGLSSTQRRASEMAHVSGITLVGQRGIGSARQEDLDAARDWGATLVPAREIAQGGVGRAVASVPEGARVAVCLDFDGLDPSVVGAVIAPTPGGLSHWDVVELVEGIAAKAQIVALGAVELMPSADVAGRGAGAAAALLTTLLGIVAPPR